MRGDCGRRVAARRAGRAADELVLSQLDGGPPGRARGARRARACGAPRQTGYVQPGTYLEPFALRALGIVREDASLLERAAERFEALGLDWHAARTRGAPLVGPVVLDELHVVEAGLRRRDRDEDGVLVPGRAKRPRRLRRDAYGRPGLEVDDLVVELGLCPTRDEEVDLLLDAVPVPARRPPPAAEALERDGEVPEPERLAQEADLEVVGSMPTSAAMSGTSATRTTL